MLIENNLSSNRQFWLSAMSELSSYIQTPPWFSPRLTSVSGWDTQLHLGQLSSILYIAMPISVALASSPWKYGMKNVREFHPKDCRTNVSICFTGLRDLCVAVASHPEIPSFDWVTDFWSQSAIAWIIPRLYGVCYKFWCWNRSRFRKRLSEVVYWELKSQCCFFD